ncbi:MAG: branched-chain amino acid ABC transporter permease [Deltaproteobacteria bacterium]|nr:branched-chain amino acid ABC transporter permease [Deltaproteobacteria bacterium]MBW2138437.1 branched-chain amino acid ABC transporter permease [Deltaproteobacteria bacterium]
MKFDREFLLRQGKLFSFLPLFALILFPVFVRDRYLLHVMIVIFVYVTLVGSWNLPGGYAGYISFGHVLFFGVGGYCTAMLMNTWGVPATVTYLVGGIVSALIALIFGYVSLRLRGPYFAIATLALATIGRYLFLNFEVFGGAEGLLLPVSPWTPEWEKIPYYYFALAIATITTLTVHLITKTRFGLGLMAIRENEEKAEGLGIDTTRHKVLAFIVSAFFPGMIGGVFASYLEYVNPDSSFSILYSANILLMAIIGGLGTVTGPILGATIIVVASEVLSFTIGHQVRLVVLGFVLVTSAIYLPGGLLSLKERTFGGEQKGVVLRED